MPNGFRKEEGASSRERDKVSFYRGGDQGGKPGDALFRGGKEFAIGSRTKNGHSYREKDSFMKANT